MISMFGNASALQILKVFRIHSRISTTPVQICGEPSCKIELRISENSVGVALSRDKFVSIEQDHEESD